MKRYWNAMPLPVQLAEGTLAAWPSRTLLLLRVAALLGLFSVGGPPGLHAAPVSVRLPEGNSRGFLVLRSQDGRVIAHGEFIQKPTGGLIDSRLLFKFKDGSLYDEHVLFSQREVFTLHQYRLVQRGRSFPTTVDVSVDRKSGQYRARQQKTGEAEEVASGQIEMPADLYNGMALTLLKNLGPGATASVQTVAFTPKPRLIKMELSPEEEGNVLLGGEKRKTTRYLVKLEIGGLTGVIASVIGKEPPDVRYWLVTGQVPAFVRFEGPMFLNGPVWQLELTTVGWPKN